MTFKKTFKQHDLNAVIKKVEQMEKDIAPAENAIDSKNNSIKKNAITVKQQILILDYLGAFDKINSVDNATKKAAFLELLLNKNEQNIRTELGKIYELKNSVLPIKKTKIKENLIKVSQIFSDLGLKSIVKKIQNDIDKLGQ
ncbi:MAG: hypothetical protein Q8891_14110 [Bacteroidota bacterium]|nr:hypothetical protein [Bacteroidota bacterium]